MEGSDHIEGTGKVKVSTRRHGRETQRVGGRGGVQPMGRLAEMVDWARWVLVVAGTTSVVVQVPAAAAGSRQPGPLDRGARDRDLATGTVIADSGQESTPESVVMTAVHWWMRTQMGELLLSRKTSLGRRNRAS